VRYFAGGVSGHNLDEIEDEIDDMAEFEDGGEIDMDLSMDEGEAGAEAASSSRSFPDLEKTDRLPELTLPEARRAASNLEEFGNIYPWESAEASRTGNMNKWSSFRSRVNDPIAEYAYDSAPHMDWTMGGDGGATQSNNKSHKGPGVDYCVFCYHGEDILRAENTGLLAKFVSERGMILPRRITHCCAKHQRKLSRTIRRSRDFGLVPHHARPHPKLRFHSWWPTQGAVEDATEAPPSVGAEGNTAGDEPAAAATGSPDPFTAAIEELASSKSAQQ
jgi:small subunit ribosomal protein S18